MRYFALFLIFLLTHSITAQYTQVINSRRPGYSESPFGVGPGVYQIEGGFFYGKSDATFLNSSQKTLGGELLLRTGLLSERFEVNLDLRYQQDELLTQLDPTMTTQVNGLSRLTVGAKYLFYMPTYKDPSKEIRSWKKKTSFDGRRLIPSVGLYAGLNTNFLGESYKNSGLSPKVALLLQHDFTNYIIWVNNFYGDYLTLKESRSYGYISTLTFSLSDRFSVFGEYQRNIVKYGLNTSRLGGGMAYLFDKDLQIDMHLQWDTKTDHTNLIGGLGASWRLDRHAYRLERKTAEKDGSGKIEAPKTKQKKGFILFRPFKKKH